MVRNHKIGNLIINFYGTPIQSGMEPYSEGCEAEDGKILIYDEKSQQPLFHKSGNIKSFEIFTSSSDIDLYKDVFSQIGNTHLIIKHFYTGNCGGCYQLLFFSISTGFKYLGSTYYDPDKYGYLSGTAARKYIEYDSNGHRIKEYPYKQDLVSGSL